MPTRSDGTAASPTTLRIIRMALLSGVLVFGIVAYVLVNRDGPLAAGDPETARTMVWINVAFLVTAAPALLYLQRKHAAERDRARANTLNIIAWAVGESVAIMGAVHWLLVGAPTPYVVGLAVMLASFVLVPIRE